MRLRWNKLGIGFVASVPTAFLLACGGRSDQVPRPDATADAPSEAAVRGEAGAGADAADDRGALPDGGAADVMGDEATVRPMGNDGAAETSPGIGAGDAATDASLQDASDEAMADAGNVEGSAEASGFGCSTYCATVMAACTGGSAQYKDMASCMSACQYFAAGAPGQSNGDLACRMTHATYAMAAPYPHCWHAGPFGYGPCGALFDSFCNIAAGPQDLQNANGVCSLGGGFDAGPAPYNSRSDCVLRAAGYRRVNMETNVQPPGLVGLDGGFSANGPAAGNTFDCRAYHLVLALQGGSTQQTECGNVGPTSTACQ